MSTTRHRALLGTMLLASCSHETDLSIGVRQSALSCAPLMAHACQLATTTEPTQVIARPGTLLGAPPVPNVSQPNTYYRITLPSNNNSGVVEFRPGRSGRWSVTYGPDVTLTVMPASGAATISSGPADPTSCGVLTRQSNINANLSNQLAYRLVFTRPAATGPSTVNVVMEFVPDYEAPRYVDADADGHGNPASSIIACGTPPGYADLGDDCNDADATVAPGLADICDDRDNDCDQDTDEDPDRTFFRDVDSDGFGTAATTIAACQPPPGYTADRTDCDDTRADISPAGLEVCDTIDNDCDAAVDEGVQTTFFRDADGDGHGDPADALAACAAPEGYVAVADDCDPTRSDVHPGATEVCDGADNDCDAAVDEDVQTTFYRDADGDGIGTVADAQVACAAPAGYVAAGGDCDDGRADVFPGAREACDGADNDCDGAVDEDVGTTFYADADGDGAGDAARTAVGCSAPAGYVASGDDCDDARADVFPGAAEVCDGADNDCDGAVDEGAGTTFYADADGDGAGNAAQTVVACAAPAGYVAAGGDCDDARADVFPGAPEVCDGADNDCDGAVDEGAGTTFYADADGDGAGNAAQTVIACSAPTGYAANGDDCDDARADVFPGAPEVCDGADNDCDGNVDEDGRRTYYRDADGDTFGDPALGQTDCRSNEGWVLDAGDCDDGNRKVNPAAEEICDGVDDDCDGETDEGGVCAAKCEVTTLDTVTRYFPFRWTTGYAKFSPPEEFIIPRSFPVTSGNAGRGFAYLLYQDTAGRPGFCLYRGTDHGQMFTMQWTWFCWPEKVVEMRWAQLIVTGSPFHGTTRASLTLTPATCDAD